MVSGTESEDQSLIEPPRKMHTWITASVGTNCSTRLFSGFNYGPVHDLESLWWLLNYLVFTYFNVTVSVRTINFADPDTAHEAEERLETLKGLNSLLFEDADARKSALLSDDVFMTSYAAWLHQLLRPVAKILERLRVELVLCYQSAEKDRDAFLNPVTWNGFYGKFAQAAHEISELAQEILSRDPTAEDSDGEVSVTDLNSPAKDASASVNDTHAPTSGISRTIAPTGDMSLSNTSTGADLKQLFLPESKTFEDETVPTGLAAPLDSVSEATTSTLLVATKLNFAYDRAKRKRVREDEEEFESRTSLKRGRR